MVVALLYDSLWLLEEDLIKKRYNLSSSQLNNYKDFMVSTGLAIISERGGKIDRVELTDKDRMFIKSCREL